MSVPSNLILWLLAVVPGALALTIGAFLLAKGWVPAIGAILASAGLSLITLFILVAVAFGFAPLSGLADSPLLLLGAPLGMFALALGVLLRRNRTSKFVSVPCAAAGLVGLYWFGGIVLMQSVCSFHSGGC